MLSIGPITKVSMNAKHGFCNCDDFVGSEEADDIRESRVGGFVAMAPAHPAADSEIVAHQAVVLDDGDKPEIVGEYIEIIYRRDHKGCFEFSGQIGLTIKRVCVTFVLRCLEV